MAKTRPDVNKDAPDEAKRLKGLRGKDRRKIKQLRDRARRNTSYYDNTH